jgi:uncharacterized protein (TIGR03067 family)
MRLGILLALAFVAGADKPKTDPLKEDLAKLQGTWVGVYFEQDGKYYPASTVKKGNIVLVISGDKYSFTSTRKSGQGCFFLDPTKKPKTIDHAATKEERSITLRGIYQVDGDTLWICGGTARPKGFTTRNNGASMLMFKRVKK